MFFLALPPPQAPPPIERQAEPFIRSEAAVALTLFVLSEIIGASKLKENGVIQMILHMGRELFPHEVRSGTATRHNRPRRRRRDEHGRFLPDDN